MYTLILKDEEMAGKRDDGREKAGISWEVEFRSGQKKEAEKEGAAGNETSKNEKTVSTMIWVPWEDFKATYRGKEKKDAGNLKTGEVRRVGIMMRRYVSPAFSTVRILEGTNAGLVIAISECKRVTLLLS